MHLLLALIASLGSIVFDSAKMAQAQSVLDDTGDDDAYEDSENYFDAQEDEETTIEDDEMEEDQEEEDTPEVAQLDFHVSLLSGYSDKDCYFHRTLEVSQKGP